MRTIILLLTILLVNGAIHAQFERNRYQTLKSTIKISAMKDGQAYVWENKNPNVVLDYKVGNLDIYLTNKDFVQSSEEQPQLTNPEEELREFVIKGIVPIDPIIQQLVIKQQYFVELSLINRELGLNNPIKFDLTVTNPGTSQKQYRMFSLHGTLDNREMMLPAFEGFDPEIEIWIGWAAYAITH
jgi:hypothetical protein